MKRNYLAFAVVLATIGLFVLIAGSIFYIVQMQNTLRIQTVTNVLDVTEQGAKAFESYIDQGIVTLEDRAENFSKYPATDVNEIRSKLDMFEGGDPSLVCMDLSSGAIYYNSGNEEKLSADALAAYRALPDEGIVEPYISEYSGKRVLGYFDKFKFSDGADGMVMKTIPINEFTDRFSLSFYDGAGFNYIVNSNGDILLRSASETGNRTFSNVFDVIALDANTNEEVAALKLAIADKKSGVMNLSFQGASYEFAFVPLEGTPDWYLISVVPYDVIMEQANQMLKTTQLFTGVVGIAILIFGAFIILIVMHRRKVKEQEIEVMFREKLFDLLANNADDVFIMLSNDAKNIEYVSPNVEEAMGVSVIDIKKQRGNLQALIGDGSQGSFISEVLSVPLEQSTISEKDFIHPVSGDHKYFIEKIYHTVLQSKERYIVVFSDRTEDRKKEDALKEALQIAKDANDSKSAFLSNMSHDIRTPMNAIIGLLTLMRRDAGNQKLVLQHTDKIASSSEHLLNLINNVLDMSKIESGEASPNIENLDLSKLIDEVVSIMRPQVEAKKQHFEVITEGIDEYELMGDRLRINQVLLNLLSNASKYTPEEGHITLMVQQVEKAAHNIVRLCFTVSDDGIGMSEEYQKHLFKPFTREVSTLVNRVQGTGLGMAITKSLVDLMGGTITVESEIDKGSTFVLELDLRVQDVKGDEAVQRDQKVDGRHAVSDGNESLPNPLKGKHFLYAEDNDLNAMILIELLSMEKATCDHVGNGKQAVEAFNNAPAGTYDAILMDIQMPIMNGYEATRSIRDLDHEQASSIRIIALTANAFAEDVADALDAGMDAHLAKPVDMSKLVEVLTALW